MILRHVRRIEVEEENRLPTFDPREEYKRFNGSSNSIVFEMMHASKIVKKPIRRKCMYVLIGNNHYNV